MNLLSFLLNYKQTKFIFPNVSCSWCVWTIQFCCVIYCSQLLAMDCIQSCRIGEDLTFSSSAEQHFSKLLEQAESGHWEILFSLSVFKALSEVTTILSFSLSLLWGHANCCIINRKMKACPKAIREITEHLRLISFQALRSWSMSWTNWALFASPCILMKVRNWVWAPSEPR